jgi:hypothetical protein
MVFTLRTDEEHRKAAQEWREARSPAAQKAVATRTGSKYSELLRLPYFNAPAMTVVDVMHAVYLGCVKHLLDLWKETGVLSSQVLEKMQRQMDNIHPPSDTGRVWRKLRANLSNLTAAELKNLITVFGTCLLLPFLKPSEVRNPCLLLVYSYCLKFVIDADIIFVSSAVLDPHQ